jgi:glycogen debranching enzyme
MPSYTEDYESMPDLSDQVPDLKPYLRSGEKVINIEEAKTLSFATLPDYRDELCKLCGVDKPEDIGKNGPAMAARAAQQGTGQGLFECRFGRDGLIAANDFLPEFPILTRTTLLDYASLIGMVEDLKREEEFGRMFHEARNSDDPIAKRISERKGWGWPFYATVDATPLFVKTLYNYVTKSTEGKAFLKQTYRGRDDETHTMWDALRYSMMWIVARINRNPERFLEYKPAFPESHVNQVMEDSWDSHFHADGTLANFIQGNCSTEVQGLVYDALLMAAELMEHHLDLQPEVAYYRKLATEIRMSVMDHLVVEDEKGMYLAVGTDRDEHGRIRIMKVRKATPFFVLNSRIFADKSNENSRLILEACARTIFSPALSCAAGVRSLAVGEARFMPGAYHNGNSWLMQTFQIAEGLREQGYHALAEELDKRIVSAVEQSKLYPEYVNGGTQKEIRLNERIVDTYDSIDKRRNRREQPPQQIQLWTLTAYGAIQYRRQHGQKKIPLTPFEEEILSNLRS